MVFLVKLSMNEKREGNVESKWRKPVCTVIESNLWKC